MNVVKNQPTTNITITAWLGKSIAINRLFYNILSTTVFFQPPNPTFEERLGNPTQTWLVHNGAILILNQTSDKPEYKVGENITISTELINLGNKSVDIGYWPPLVVLEIKDQKGTLVGLKILTLWLSRKFMA